MVQFQHKTAARIFAESDMQNNFTMTFMLYTYAMGLCANMFFNWDATQYSVTQETDNSVVVIKLEGDKAPTTAASSGTIAVSIKHFHFQNVTGEVAPPVFQVADDSLSPDEFPEPIKVGDLGITSDISSYGWICFKKLVTEKPLSVLGTRMRSFVL